MFNKKEETKKEELSFDDLINFNFTEDLGLNELSEEEQEEYNSKLFSVLMDRIIEKTSRNFSEEDKAGLVKIIDENKDLGVLFDYILERNENFVEEMGEEFLEFKKEIYEVLRGDNK